MFYEILFELSNVLKLQSYSFCPTSLYLPTPSKFHSYWLAVYSVCTAAIVPYEWAWPRSSGQQPTQRLDVCSSMIAANSFYATHCEVQSPSFVRVSQTRKRTTKPNNRLGKIRQECRPDFSIPDPNTSFRCVLLRCGGVWFRGSASHPTAEHSERHTRLCASSPYVEAVRCGVELKLMMLLSRLSDYYRKYFEIEIVIIRSLRDWCGFLAVSFGLDPLVYPKRAWPLALLYGAIQSEVMGTDCRFAGIHGLSS